MRTIKESSDFLEMKAASIDRDILEIKKEIGSNQRQLDETRSEKYKIDSQLAEASERINSKKKVFILFILVIFICLIVSYSINNLIPIALSIFVVLPIAAYSSKDYFSDLKIYDEQNLIRAGKMEKIRNFDNIISQHNENLKNLNKKYNDYTKGLIGEKRVTEALKRLEYDNYLINDVTLDAAFGNIDHILVSRYGIFIIETKNWDGEIVCDGDNWNRHYEHENNFFDLEIKSISKRVKGNAKKLRLLIESKIFNNLMTVWVEGIIVFTNSSTKLKIIHPTVPVMTVDDLNDYITRQQPLIKFSSKDLESIANLIHKYAKIEF
jgi:hypothetical protein